MILPLTQKSGDPARHVLFVTSPALWPAYPFLPVVRRTRGREELGVLADLFGLYGLTGYGSTVFLTNLFGLPPTLGRFLALPRETYDTGDELVRGGWRVD